MRSHALSELCSSTRRATRALVLAGALALAAAPAAADQSNLWSPTTGTVSGLNLTNNYNSALNALATCNSGAAAPTNPVSGAPVAGQCWYNTSTGVVSTYDGAQWLPVGKIDAANHVWTPIVGGNVATTVASATTTNLCGASGAAPNGAFLTISGTTTITGFGSNCVAGQVKIIAFSGALTLTYNATSLILPTAANITTAAGDSAVAVSLGGGNWQVVSYQRASGAPLTHGLVGVQTFTVSGTFTADPGTNSCIVEVQAAGGGSGGSQATSTNQFAMGGAGAAGSYARAYFSPCAPTGDAVTIGAFGAAGAAAGGNGGTGAATTVGAHVSCPGGLGGSNGPPAGSTSAALAIGGAAQPAPCTVTGASQTMASEAGGPGQYGFSFTNNNAVSGYGGSSQLGQGPHGVGCNTAGVAGNNYGSGGSGSLACASVSGPAGGAGGPAIVNIYEYN